MLSLPENKKYIRFVSKHWHNYTEIFNELWYTKMAVAHKTHLTNLLTEHTLSTIEISNIPDIIKSHFRNIVCARRSIWNKVAASVTLENKRKMGKMRKIC
jgi:hypothetical protein